MLILPLRPLTHGAHEAQSRTAQTAAAKLFLPLCSLLPPLAEGPLVPTLLRVDAVLTAFLLLIYSSAKVLNCRSGGRFRFGNSSLLCSLIFTFSKQRTALVCEICALIRCFLHFPDSWLVFVGLQRATDTRNLIKAVRVLTVSAFLMLR